MINSRKDEVFEAVVVGGGFAGLSTAYHLAKSGVRGILVLEQEKRFGSHASGNNAGMIRQTIPNTAMARMARRGCRGFSRLKLKREWRALKLHSNGSMLLAKGRELKELKRIQRVLRKEKLKSYLFSKEEAVRQVPLLRDGDFEKGLFCPSDAMLDIRALIQNFLREFRRLRVKSCCGCKITGITRREGVFEVRVRGFRGGRPFEGSFRARRLVNAAGAWAASVGSKAKALPLPLIPYKRHLFLSHFSPAFKAHWPFVWDLSNQFYFRPVAGKKLLLSACDKVAFRMSDRVDTREAERVHTGVLKELKRKLKKFSKNFSGLRIKEKRAGLRTMTPDGNFVIGEDPWVKGFYWVAGLGGHGVTTSLSVGRLASDIILERRGDRELRKAFDPKRFLKRH